MKQLCIVSNFEDRAASISRQLDGMFAVQTLSVNEFATEKPRAFTVVDVDLNDAINAGQLRYWLQQRPKESRAIFVVDRGSRVQTVRAYSIGATDIVRRPIRYEELLCKLLGERESRFGESPTSSFDLSDGITAGISALEHIFLAANSGAVLNPQLIAAAGEALVLQIETYGFADWVQAVRVHHSQTYQHCLLVCGAAAAFAQQLCFNQADRRRVAIAALLHDIGKARVPISILEKPSQLDDDEMAAMKRHPEYGYEALRTIDGIQSELLDMVLHHHEYLDGSGYPHGLQASEISDLTRIVTIADIFGALIERRPYKAPLAGSTAYQVLLDMNRKLDRDLVRAFHPLSRVQFA